MRTEINHASICSTNDVSCASSLSEAGPYLNYYGSFSVLTNNGYHYKFERIDFTTLKCNCSIFTNQAYFNRKHLKALRFAKFKLLVLATQHRLSDSLSNV